MATSSVSICIVNIEGLRHQHHHHQSLNRESRWGTTYDFATSFLHFSLFSTALWDLPNSTQDVFFPPLPLSALSSSPFHCALQDALFGYYTDTVAEEKSLIINYLILILKCVHTNINTVSKPVLNTYFKNKYCSEKTQNLMLV